MPRPYLGLDYSGLVLQSDPASVPKGNLKTFSPPNDIFFSAATENTDGTAIITPATGTFDLTSVHFGCSNNAGAARVPQDCTVIATATTNSGETHKATLKFMAGKTMEMVHFPSSFTQLIQVTFVQHPTGDNSAVSFDNLAYCLRKSLFSGWT